jgi:putative transcriptional regulator
MFEKFADKMINYRKSNKLTQQDLAIKLGISRVYVSDLERGKAKGTLKIRIKLAEISGKGLAYWLDSDVEVGYMPFTLLSAVIDEGVRAGKVDIETGNISEDYMPQVLRMLKAEIVYNHVNENKEDHI